MARNLNTTTRLVTITFLINFFFLGCSPQSSQNWSSVELVNKLDRLLEIRRQKGFPLDDLLNPGLSRQEIEQKTQGLPFKLPEEIYALYQWRNGFKKTDCYPFFFRDNLFISLDQALIEYQHILKFYGSENALSDYNLKECFPFASFDGSWYVIPVRGHPGQRPVIEVYEGITAYFLSLEKMVDTQIKWYENGIHSPESFKIDRDHEIEIWKQLNPGIL